jgi:serine/threonine protein kinase
MHRLTPGLVLGERYRLERRIASGGMADVWTAQDEVLQRMVALKVMRPDPDHEELFALRFRDFDMLISNQITNQSQLLMNRTIQERVQDIAPFLHYDKDPYLVIDGGGRLRSAVS